MKRVFSKRLCAEFLAVSALLTPLPGYAQDVTITLQPIRVEEEAADDSSRTEYVKKDATSATKTTTPVSETPQSVTVITRKQLDDQNPQTVKDALNYTAGILSSPDSTSRYDSFFLRGFGGFGTSTRVVDFLDGLKLAKGQAFALPSVDPFLLDSIEVLKGPSGVLYGETSPGGLVNQNSRMPSTRSYNEARLETGTDGQINAGATSQGKINGNDQWQYSITGIGRHADSRYDDVEEQREGFNSALTWAPSSDTHLTLQTFYQHDPDGGYFNSLYPKALAADAYKSALSRDLNVGDPTFDSYDRTQYHMGYSFEHRVSDLLSLSSKTRYSAIDLDFKSLQMAGALTASGTIPRNAYHSQESVDGIATDNSARFTYKTGAIDHTTLAGLDFQRSTSTWEYGYAAASSLNVTNPQYGAAIGSFTTIINNNQSLEQTGAYLQDQLSLGGLRVVLGTRHDWTEQKTENLLTNRTSNQSSDASTYRAGVLYKFDNGIAPYASYSTSFEPTVGVDAEGNTFKPTKGKQWEAGLKYEPTNLNALFTATVFDIRQENVLTPGATTGFNVQQGEVQSRGVELEARGTITKPLEVIAALTLQDTEVTKSTVATTVGKRPQAVPEYYGSLWANYTLDSGLMNGLTLGSGLRFVGSSFADDANTIKTSGYTLVDASLRYELEHVSPSLSGAQATLNATNLFDTEYYSSCTSSYYCQYGDGAQVLLGLRYRM